MKNKLLVILLLLLGLVLGPALCSKVQQVEQKYELIDASVCDVQQASRVIYGQYQDLIVALDLYPDVACGVRLVILGLGMHADNDALLAAREYLIEEVKKVIKGEPVTLSDGTTLTFKSGYPAFRYKVTINLTQTTRNMIMQFAESSSVNGNTIELIGFRERTDPTNL